MSGAFAQQVNVAAGGETKGTGGSETYCIGQIFFATHLSLNESLSDGSHNEQYTGFVIELTDIKPIK